MDNSENANIGNVRAYANCLNNCINNCRCRGFYYVIKEGDSLYQLSRAYNVSVSDLIMANPYINVYNLQINDEICIPKAIEVELAK
ncbi:LysM peptidoglycan-binding domain-containing protein [Konateibacter massiliensis]|uniref:LysM peptidoglycan-binding domain-containing protein n=1 Tax=Konateibacter massiliensis TaxID=2002841 RepID=UPI000C148136|nr:LysM domain-containing protein [Konateibacter massiliensis]